MRGSRLRGLVLAMSGALAVGCDYQALPAIEGPLPDAGASPDAPAMWASCQGLPKTCGPTGTDDCCNPASTIVGGTYYRSYDLAGDSYSGDQSAPATISTFRLDKYKVTVGRFRAFVNAGKGTQASPPAPGSGAHAAIAGSGWNASWNASLPADKAALISGVNCSVTYQTWTDTPGANEALPMNCIGWYQALAFCIWDGGYLPTEAEWNYAATGGNEQRAYPWSSPAGSTLVDTARATYSSPVTTTVGAKPAGDGRWGQSDLAGNVREWTLDRNGTYVTPCADCAQISSGTSRVVRGGSFSDVASNLRTGSRLTYGPTIRDFNFGVRCARASVEGA